MTRTPISLALLAFCAAGLIPSTVAHAQWYYTRSAAATRPAPLYPYEVQPGQPYAIEVAPGAYVIQRPAQRAYSRVQPASPPPKRQSREARPRKFDRPPKPADRGLIEELRERKIKRKVVHTNKIVREKPIVIETRPGWSSAITMLTTCRCRRLRHVSGTSSAVPMQVSSAMAGV